jgi:hypothetical protein
MIGSRCRSLLMISRVACRMDNSLREPQPRARLTFDAVCSIVPILSIAVALAPSRSMSLATFSGA